MLSARYNVGPADAVQQLRGFMGGGGGGGIGGGGGGGGGAGGRPPSSDNIADDIADRFVSRLPNPFDGILELKDSLALTPDQVTKLQASSQVFHIRVDSLGNAIRSQLKNLGANIDATSMMTIMRRENTAVRTVMHNAIDEAQKELTPEQWAKVPETIRTPPANRGGFGGGGGQRGGANRGGGGAGNGSNGSTPPAPGSATPATPTPTPPAGKHPRQQLAVAYPRRRLQRRQLVPGKPPQLQRPHLRERLRPQPVRNRLAVRRPTRALLQPELLQPELLQPELLQPELLQRSCARDQHAARDTWGRGDRHEQRSIASRPSGTDSKRLAVGHDARSTKRWGGPANYADTDRLE